MKNLYDAPVNCTVTRSDPQLVEQCIAPIANLLDQRRTLMEKLEIVDATINQTRKMVSQE